MKTYGCYNREPYVKSVEVQDGWERVGSWKFPVVINVPFVMSPQCNYKDTELGKKDGRCEGCKWRTT